MPRRKPLSLRLPPDLEAAVRGRGGSLSATLIALLRDGLAVPIRQEEAAAEEALRWACRFEPSEGERRACLKPLQDSTLRAFLRTQPVSTSFVAFMAATSAYEAALWATAAKRAVPIAPVAPTR
jgi:hypothetical protein